MSENAGKKQGNTKFKKGQSGNPKGKSKGTKNKATLAAEILLEGELEAICRKLIEQAQEGNIQAIKLVLDRILPPKRNPTISLELPKLKTSHDALEAITAITQAVGNGDVSPQEGETLSKIIDVYVKALEAHEFERRLNVLENKSK